MQTNRFEVSGYLGAKPQLRELPSGTPVANVRLAQTYFYETKEGRAKQTNWFNLVFYGSLAAVAMSYEKGDNINVVGSIQQRQFTPKDGSPRTIQEVVIQQCHRIASHREVVPSELPQEVESIGTDNQITEAENVIPEPADESAVV